MKKTLFKNLEIAGVFFVFISGVLLHFLYDWTNGNVCGILFGAVNESVWEHLKIFAMPYVVWSVFEIALAMPYFKMFVIAKVCGLYSMSVLITVFYYLYSGIIGTNILAVDIVSSFVWVAVAFVISYRLTTSQKDLRKFFPLALFMLLLYFAMYFSFTAAPPHIDLFKDKVTNTYGIPYFNTFDFKEVFGNAIAV